MNTTEMGVIPQVCNETAMCSSLLNRLEDGRRKGFEALHTTNLETDEERFLGVVYRTSVKDRGLMLNWCPFCGGQPGCFERK